jgi:VWFA-related protein
MPGASRRNHHPGVGCFDAPPAASFAASLVASFVLASLPFASSFSVVVAFAAPSQAQTVGGSAARAQDESEIEYVDTNLTTVLLTAADRKGRLVNTLRAEDVRVFEDGAEQRVTTFERQTERPLSLALVFDTSGSQWRTLPDQKRAARLFLRSIFRPDRDRAAVVSFAGGAVLRQSFTGDLKRLEKAVDDLSVPDAQQLEEARRGATPGPAPYFGTSIYDTLFLTCYKVLTKSPPGARRAIILLTDGMDNGSRLTPRDAVNGAAYADAVVYGIGIGYRVNAESLAAVTEETAGRAFFPADKGELRAAFSRIEQELRSQYLVAYTPTNRARDGKRRDVRVEIANTEIAKQGVRLAYRSYYYVKKSAAAGAKP